MASAGAVEVRRSTVVPDFARAAGRSPALVAMAALAFAACGAPGSPDLESIEPLSSTTFCAEKGHDISPRPSITGERKTVAFDDATDTLGAVIYATAPSIGDVNGDGVADIVIPGADGVVYIAINCLDRYYLIDLAERTSSSSVLPVAPTSSAIIDLDRDGRKDLLIGENRSLFAFYAEDGLRFATKKILSVSGYTTIIGVSAFRPDPTVPFPDLAVATHKLGPQGPRDREEADAVNRDLVNLGKERAFLDVTDDQPRALRKLGGRLSYAIGFASRSALGLRPLRYDINDNARNTVYEYDNGWSLIDITSDDAFAGNSMGGCHIYVGGTTAWVTSETAAVAIIGVTNDGNLVDWHEHVKMPVQMAGAGQDPASFFNFWSGQCGDLNNDGRMDIILNTATPGGSERWGTGDKNRLIVLQQDGGGAFSNVSDDAGPLSDGTEITSGHGVSIGDLNLDGCQDAVFGGHLLLESSRHGGDPSGAFDTPVRIAINRCDYGNDFIRLRLKADDAGAMARLETEDGEAMLREVIGYASLGVTRERVLHFGLGRAKVRKVTVFDPFGNQTAEIDSPKLDTTVDVDNGRL